jgi:hypothetical protein
MELKVGAVLVIILGRRVGFRLATKGNKGGRSKKEIGDYPCTKCRLLSTLNTQKTPNFFYALRALKFCADDDKKQSFEKPTLTQKNPTYQ